MTRPVARFALTWLDVLIVNLLLYLLVRAIVLHPLGFHPLWEVSLWAVLLTLALGVFYALQPWHERPTLWRLGLQWVLFAGLVAFVFVTSNVEVTAKGDDWSWLRPEVIKVVYWPKMLIPLSPLFTAFFGWMVGLLMWLAIVSPRSGWLRVIPVLGAALLVWKILQVFTPFGGLALGDVGPPVRTKLLQIYIGMFAGPWLVVCVLLWVRFFAMAFRLVPVAFHLILIGLHYMGTLPVHSLYDVLPLTIDRHAAVTRTPGVSLFYPPPGASADPSFLFLRKMIGTRETLYLNYGPTCGLYAIDRRTRGARRLAIPGLMRDLQQAPDGSSLWGLNWLNGDFLAIRTNPLTVGCERDLFGLGLTTPYNMVVDGRRLWMTNITHPIVAELSWEDPADPCSLRLDRALDLYSSGYTKFTDGAFGLYLDRHTDRLYVCVGLIAESDLTSLVEIDLHTLHVTRDVKLTGGMHVFSVEGRRSVLVPSYYRAELHEISLDEMKVLRTIEAGPNVVSLAHDRRRGLFYALCRAPGLLQVIEDGAGQVIKEIPVGPKPEPLWLDRDADQLFVGSGIGVLAIDLPVFLGEVPPRATDAPAAAPDRAAMPSL